MVDERTQVLLNDELDGALDAGARAELDQLLAGSAEARALRADLGRIAAAIERLPQEAAPAGLRESISHAIQAAAPRSRVVSLDARRPRRTEFTRVGFALAAGVALGAIGLVAYQAYQPGSDGSDAMLAGIRGVDAGEMAGTMVRRGASEETEVSTLKIDTPEVRGTATLYEGQGVLILQFDLDSSQAVTVDADYDSSSLRLLGFAQGAVEDSNITSAAGRVGYVNHGEQRFSMYLQRTAAQAAQVRVALRSGGAIVHQAVLEIPANL